MYRWENNIQEDLEENIKVWSGFIWLSIQPRHGLLKAH
jgi:hypothetical protein